MTFHIAVDDFMASRLGVPTMDPFNCSSQTIECLLAIQCYLQVIGRRLRTRMAYTFGLFPHDEEWYSKTTVVATGGNIQTCIAFLEW